MYCSKCGNQVEENAKFCGGCGATTQEQSEASVSGEKKDQVMVLPQNKKLVFGGLGALVVIVLVVVLMNKGGGINNSPMNVTKALFKAIDKQDANAFIKCIAPEALEELKYYSDNYMKDLKEEISYMDEMFEEEYGKNWSNKMKYKAVGSREIEVTMEGEDDVVEVEKIDGKYYIDPNNLF